MTYYCMNCWSEIEKDTIICPNCGYDQQKLSNESFSNKLLKAINHPEPQTIIRAANILGELKIKEAIPSLLSKLETEKDPFIIKAVVESLLKIDNSLFHRIREVVSDKQQLFIKKILEKQMSQNSKIVIPENHKRSLSVTARHIESSLNDMEELLKKERKESVTEKIIFNMTQEHREKILENIKIIREKNKNMFEELDLNGNVFYEDRIIRSRISHIWTLLCESTANALKGYGDLNAEQAQIIDKHINSLLDTVQEIQSIIH